MTITFQIFDPEWDEYVDLEEDSIINHKDKLKVVIKVVISPCLTDPTSSRSQSSVCSSGPMEEVVELLLVFILPLLFTVYLFILLGICP